MTDGGKVKSPKYVTMRYDALTLKPSQFADYLGV